MSLIERIRTDQRTARVLSRAESGRLKATLLTTLLGEISRVKDANAGEPTDAEVTTVVRKMLKNADEVLTHRPDSEGVKTEKAILLSYLPTQLTDEQVVEYLQTFAPEQRNMKHIKLILTTLEEKFPGQVTGHQLAAILKSM